MRRPASTYLPLTLLLLAAAGLLAPLVVLVVGGFLQTTKAGGSAFSLAHFQAAWAEPGSLEALRHAVVFAGGAAACGVILGTAAAWLCERTDLPLRGLLRLAMVVPLFVPGVLYSFAWILLGSPRIGMLNTGFQALTGVEFPLFSIYGMGGMIAVEGLHAAPMVFLLVTAMLRRLDPSQEMAAQVAGARPWRILQSITLPLLGPTLGSSFLLVLIRALGTFEVPTMLGLPAGVEVVSSRIFRALQDHPGDTGPAGAYAAGLLFLTLAVMGLHEWWVPSRLHQASRAFGTDGMVPFRLGKARPFMGLLTGMAVLLMAGLPLIAIFWSSLQPFFAQPGSEAFARVTLQGYRQVLASPEVAAAAWQTLRLCALAATLVMAVCLAAAWVLERTRVPGRSLLEPAFNAVLALPGIVLGIALLVFHTRMNTGLYGTAGLILLAYVTRYLPYGLRYGRAALGQVPPELEQAARCSGAGPLRTWFQITLPLVAPGLLAGWLYVAIVSAREMSSALLLYSPGQEVLTVLVWQYWEGGQTMQVSALSVLFILALLLGASVSWLLGRKRPFRGF